MDGEGQEQSATVMQSGTSHEHRINGPGAEIRSDFDHNGRVALTDEEHDVSYQKARAFRQRRAGSILLPILDPDLVRDGLREEYLTPVQVHPLGQSLQEGDELELRFEHRPNEKRVVGYRQEEGTWHHVLGLRPDGVRPKKPPSERETIPVPAGWTGTNLRMYAATLAGDPRRPGPVSSPGAPRESIYRKPVRPGEVWMRLHHRRDALPSAADDLALFLIAPFLLPTPLEPAHRLYTVSKWETHNFVYDVMEACWTAFGERGPFPRAPHDPFAPSTPPRRRRGKGRTVDPDDEERLSSDKMYLINGENYRDPWIQDQMAIGYCSAPGGRAFNVVLHCKRDGPLHQFVSQQMGDETDRLFVFEGIAGPAKDDTDYGGNIAVSPPVMEQTDAQDDDWAGPRVPAHPRAPHGKLIIGDCYNPEREEIKKAGKDGTVHEETRHFLQSQGVQPIIPIDTSWLAVGHVDEIMEFVPGPDVNTPQLAMARPDVMIELLDRTIQESAVRQGRTHFHRGRHTEHLQLQQILRFPDFLQLLKTYPEHGYSEDEIKDDLKEKAPHSYEERYDDMSVEDILPDFINEYKNKKRIFAGSYDETSVEEMCAPSIQSLNRNITNWFLAPIERRLCNCTGLGKEDVLPLPVYFEPLKRAHSIAPGEQDLVGARTPNLVNMQVLNTDRGTHLLLPRPFGPRLPPQKAENVVRAVLNQTGQGDTDVCRPQTKQDGRPGFQFWVWPTLEAHTLALFFTRKRHTDQGKQVFLTRAERDRLIKAIVEREPLNALPSPLQTAVEHTKQVILDANGGASRLLRNGRFTSWHRLFIPEDTVDVIEAYTKSVLAHIGCQVHFVDAWYHHTGTGGVHCATNVLHRPPSAESGNNERSPWWENYPKLAAADTLYNPFNTVD